MAIRPALQLAMPSVPTAATAVQQPAPHAEPGTPTGAGASTAPLQEQGSAESYNSEQGFGSPVRKRHGTHVSVCDGGCRRAFLLARTLPEWRQAPHLVCITLTAYR